MSAATGTADGLAGRWWAPAASRHWSEGLLWLLGGLLASVVMTWPLVLHLPEVVPQSTADPLAQAWHVAWGGHALLAQPGALYDGNTYWPDGPALAFADAMLGLAPSALVGEGPVAALVRYNLLFLLAYGLVFAAAGLLARELGLQVPAALVVATAAAFTPTRTMQNNHLNVLSVGGVVLTLFLLLSGYRRRRSWQVLAGWLAAAWQMSIGFAMGIWFAYLLAALSAAALVTWLRRGRPRLPRAMVVSTAAGAAVLGAATVLLLLPYLEVIDTYPAAQQRERADVAFYSPPPRSLLVASAESRLWGQPSAALRETLSWPTEQALYPGVVAVALACAGASWRGAARRLRVSLAAATVLLVLLSLGLSLADGLLYEPLYRYAPGWANLRTPGRLAFLWSLLLAVLAGFGAQRALLAARARGLPAAAAGGACAVLAAAVAVDGSFRLPLQTVDRPPVSLASLPAPQLHLPSDFYLDPLYMLWSTDGFPPIANGAGSFDPPVLQGLRRLEGFPDADSVAALRQRGIRTVVLHPRGLAGSPWEDATQRPLDALGIGRRQVGDAVVFDLEPGR